MNQSKHTELPYRISGNSIVKEENHLEHKILEMYCSHIVDRETMQANAEFIVKACNNHYQLLEACKEANEYFKKTMPSAIPSDLVRLFNITNKAINQAEGK